MINNLFKKSKQKILTLEELKSLEDDITHREKEFNLRQRQKKVESEFKKNNNIDLDKLKKTLIGIVVGVILAIIIFKVVGKFI